MVMSSASVLRLKGYYWRKNARFFMSWYREADHSKESSYSPPQVVEQKLDAGGNYVGTAPDGTSVPRPLDTGPSGLG